MKKIYTVFLLLLALPLLRAQDGALADRSGQLDSFEFKLYPNPVTNGIVNIVTSDLSQKEVFIYDVFGIERRHYSVRESNALDISGLEKGVYILRLISSEKVATRKLIIK